jgi:UDP-N-acetylglucosamine/UDP-N-acetylgalactosamine diphosphorylase
MPESRVTPEPSALAECLARHGQQHLLEGLESVDAAVRSAFLERLRSVDWNELGEPPEPPDPGDVESSRVATLAELAQRRDQLVTAGEDAYGSGRVGVFIVAGGQGTRLGFPGPKGCFPLAPHSGKTIYQLQAEKVLSASRRVGHDLTLLVMTSPATDAETRRFFAAHDHFGLPPGLVHFFCQGTVPSLDRGGRALLAGPGKLLENPDGHGGAFAALVGSGHLERLQRDGVTHLVYLQVDNVLGPVDDPALVGLALEEGADVVTKVLEKTNPDEKVGHLVRVGGRDRIVEYTELTPQQTRARTSDGALVYRWGSPAMHCWSVAFLADLAARRYALPLHRSPKPLTAWVDGELRAVEGWKYERFIFDLVPQAEVSIGMEIDRSSEFAPVKNAHGADSPETAVELAHRQYVAWLEAAGVKVSLPPEARIEIGPLLGATREQFLANWDGRVSEVRGDCYLDAL